MSIKCAKQQFKERLQESLAKRVETGEIDEDEATAIFVEEMESFDDEYGDYLYGGYKERDFDD